jgi:hypothetical protein
MRRNVPRRLVPLAAALALAACADPPNVPPVPPGGPLDFTIDGLSFHISSGGFIRSGQQFTIYFTDQPNTCTAVLLIPQQIFLSLLLKVSPPSDGTSTATIGAPSPVVYPPSGMAGGQLSKLAPSLSPPYQVAQQVVASASGTVTWQANADGTITVLLLDMGFTGTTDRLVTHSLTIPPCN